MPKTKAPEVRFALGGEIVSTKRHAFRILARAVAKKQEWLIPQCRAVAAKLPS